jgi:hypothetical protein
MGNEDERHNVVIVICAVRKEFHYFAFRDSPHDFRLAKHRVGC